MRHHLFDAQQPNYQVAILIKPTNFNKGELQQHYVDVLVKQGIPASKIIAFDLDYQGKKVNATTIKNYLTQLMPALQSLGITHIYCADAAYFKALTKQTKAEPHFGYVMPCKVAGFEHMQIVLGMNFGALIHNPNQYPKLDMSLKTLSSVLNGNYQALGQNVIEHEDYPNTLQKMEWFLNTLHQHSKLTCDIEAFSLNLFEAHLATISFAWDEHSGGAFLVDYVPLPEQNEDRHWGFYRENPEPKKLLKQFFERYRGKIIFHNATYDVKVLILNLFMSHPQDYEGMLYGLDVMSRHIHDTKMIAYLSLNTTADIDLSLKGLAHEYLGNYAQEDIKDIRLIAPVELLRYNLTDCLGTWYVYKKYYPIMLQDNQLSIYQQIMLPTLKVVLQMELVGMPIYPDKVKELEKTLLEGKAKHIALLFQSPTIQAVQLQLQREALAKINSKLKTIQHGMDKVKDFKFNPGSSDQLRVLLYDLMKLPKIDFTDSKQPATGGKTLAKLINHATDPDHIEVLKNLIELAKITKILDTFIPAFNSATVKADGMGYLHASFNINGTLSGRMSCSEPNLQQIPSNSDYAKPVKQCFNAPKGWLLCGADFSSLEDRINTLLTKDRNKLKVYTDGFDGHALRAAYYFRETLDYIDISDPQSVNQLADKKHRHYYLRQDSKAPTFALTYAGTWTTLVKNCGFSEVMAKQIEANYHELYRESDLWTQEKLDLCCKQGYIDVAFGLRIRTPLLAKSILGNSKTIREASAEARSVGNAISGQSYGLLNNRAAIAFMERVWASKYRYSIFIVSMIHDAIYLMIKDDIEVLQWVNKHLTEEMAWQELPEIQHPEVKLGAELDVYYKGWHQPITLPLNESNENMLALIKKRAYEYDHPKKK